jgi:hypothetical protein
MCKHNIIVTDAPSRRHIRINNKLKLKPLKGLNTLQITINFNLIEYVNDNVYSNFNKFFLYFYSRVARLPFQWTVYLGIDFA